MEANTPPAPSAATPRRAPPRPSLTRTDVKELVRDGTATLRKDIGAIKKAGSANGRASKAQLAAIRKLQKAIDAIKADGKALKKAVGGIKPADPIDHGAKLGELEGLIKAIQSAPGAAIDQAMLDEAVAKAIASQRAEDERDSMFMERTFRKHGSVIVFVEVFIVAAAILFWMPPHDIASHVSQAFSATFAYNAEGFLKSVKAGVSDTVKKQLEEQGKQATAERKELGEKLGKLEGAVAASGTRIDGLAAEVKAAAAESADAKGTAAEAKSAAEKTGEFLDALKKELERPAPQPVPQPAPVSAKVNPEAGTASQGGMLVRSGQRALQDRFTPYPVQVGPNIQKWWSATRFIDKKRRIELASPDEVIMVWRFKTWRKNQDRDDIEVKAIDHIDYVEVKKPDGSVEIQTVFRIPDDVEYVGLYIPKIPADGKVPVFKVWEK